MLSAAQCQWASVELLVVYFQQMSEGPNALHCYKFAYEIYNSCHAEKYGKEIARKSSSHQKVHFHCRMTHMIHNDIAFLSRLEQETEDKDENVR